MPYTTTPGFRCRGCGHLHGAEHAGVEPTPTECPVCSKEDWETLGTHVPRTAAQDEAENLERCKGEAARLIAKRDHWQKERAAIVAQYHATADAHDAMAKKGPAGRRPKHYADHADQLAKLKQECRELEGLEWTDRDAKLLAHHEATIAAGGKALREFNEHLGRIEMSVIDRPAAFDKGA